MLPGEIMVDVIGIGAGVVDALKRKGLPVRGVNVAEAPSVSGRYDRLRDELWWKARGWFESRDSTMPDDQDLLAELSLVKYGFTPVGQIKIEAKDEIKKRIAQSPDLADAFCLTFAGGTLKLSKARSMRYERKKFWRRLGTAWGA
jgi:hypothetical protein